MSNLKVPFAKSSWIKNTVRKSWRKIVAKIYSKRRILSPINSIYPKRQSKLSDRGNLMRCCSRKKRNNSNSIVRSLKLTPFHLQLIPRTTTSTRKNKLKTKSRSSKSSKKLQNEIHCSSNIYKPTPSSSKNAESRKVLAHNYKTIHFSISQLPGLFMPICSTR